LSPRGVLPAHDVEDGAAGRPVAGGGFANFSCNFVNSSYSD
jgi:hypothetical protein